MLTIYRGVSLSCAVALGVAGLGMPGAAMAGAEAERLKSIIAGDHRSGKNKVRDKYRHPYKTLMFFGLKPQMTVVEIWPSRGWYLEIIAPYIKDKGTYYAADRDFAVEDARHRKSMSRLRQKLGTREDLFGDVIVTTLSRNPAVIPKNNIAPPGTADMVLTFRSVHNWMKHGTSREIFAAMFRALKRGGVLGIVEHRVSVSAPVDPKAVSGYMQELQVKRLAKAAGFVFVKSSEINANPKDTRTHPKGVWTLPPALRLKNKDRAKYLAIGESDRMTLLFRKR